MTRTSSPRKKSPVFKKKLGKLSTVQIELSENVMRPGLESLSLFILIIS